MGGLPTLRVLLDDGTGTFPYNVSAYVHMPTNWSVRRGRQDEFSTVEASQLQLRFDNTDGRFTLGSATYGIHVDQRIRVEETVGGVTSKRFTGYVEAWPTTWPSPTATYAVAQVSAIDRQARLARRKLRSILENEIVTDGPAAYYALGEPTVSTSAGDTSGNGLPTLKQRGSGAAVSFGAVGPVGAEGTTSPQFADGKYLSTVVPSATWLALEVFVKTSTLPSTQSEIVGAVGAGLTELSLSLMPDGRVRVTSGYSFAQATITGGTVIADGQFHHLAARHTGSEIQLYVDGALDALPFSTTQGAVTSLRVGRDFTGTLGHVVAYSATPSTARIAARASAGLTGGAGESSSARIARLAQYANIPSAEQLLETGNLTNVPVQAMNDSQTLDAIRAVELAEGGSVFIDGSGSLVLQNRQHRVVKATTTASLAITSSDVDHDNLVITGDKQYLKNYVEGSRDGGATQTVANAASIATYEQYPDSALSSLLVTTDDEVLDAISWRASAYAQPQSRMSSVTIDLLTQTTAVQQAVLALTLGDRMTISGLPSQSPMSTADLLIEGWEEVQSDQEWRITFNTSPASISQAWVLGDSTFGVLGSTTKLYY